MAENFGEKNYIYCQFSFDYIRHKYRPGMSKFSGGIGKFFLHLLSVFFDYIRHKYCFKRSR